MRKVCAQRRNLLLDGTQALSEAAEQLNHLIELRVGSPEPLVHEVFQILCHVNRLPAAG